MLYKGEKGVNVATRPPEGDPAEAGDLSASSHVAWPPAKNVRNFAEKPLHEAATDRASSLRGIFVSASHQTELDTRSMTRKSIIVGIRGGKVGHEPRY